jgi:hypothetical protein
MLGSPRLSARTISGLLFLGLVVALGTFSLWAGHNNFRNQGVGGISIDAEGVLRKADPASTKVLTNQLRKDIQQAPQALMAPIGMRMVSLRGLQTAILDAHKNNLGQLPDEVRFLAGLQRIQYVLVYPEKNDVVLAGPGEGWRVDDNAHIVGITTGRPVLQLDHLVTALRTVDAAREIGITCSIDPTEQGVKQLQALLNRYKRANIQLNPLAMEPAMKNAFGPQQIRFTGIPETSHFARVMVAADYKMKRIAMKLDRSPVKGLPSYIDMIKGRSVSAEVNPRWWLACDYEPMARSADGLAWELRGGGVKAMTENEIVQADGTVQQTGKVDPMAQRWADLMTERYDLLSAQDPVFGELRNIMDMCVVSALIRQEGMLEKVNLDLSTLCSADDSPLEIEVWHMAKQVAPQCSFLKTRLGWIVTASGGVDVDSWRVVSKNVVDPAVKAARTKAGYPEDSKNFWWN